MPNPTLLLQHLFLQSSQQHRNVQKFPRGYPRQQLCCAILDKLRSAVPQLDSCIISNSDKSVCSSDKSVCSSDMSACSSPVSLSPPLIPPFLHNLKHLLHPLLQHHLLPSMQYNLRYYTVCFLTVWYLTACSPSICYLTVWNLTA
jgi:hypothetical protein